MHELLQALAARLMPRAAGTEEATHVGHYLQARRAALSELEQHELDAFLQALAAEAERRHAAAFAALRGTQQDELLKEAEQPESPAWCGAGAWFQRLLSWAAEGAYGVEGPQSRESWREMGYGAPSFTALPSARFSSAELEPNGTYDVVVVGAGVAGCIAAGVLGAAGMRVLILERGDDARARAVNAGHLENHRLSLYGHNTGPELSGNPRVLVDAEGREHVLLPHQNGYHNNAVCIGGGGLVFGGQAWRYQPVDFRMASQYGVPAGSSLADWPLAYAELEPYYERAEWELGVAGEPGACLGSASGKGYPMPPHRGHVGRQVLVRGAHALGWRTHGVPLLINSVPRSGRGACIRCNTCVGFACPSDAKNGGHNTFLRRGLETGNVTLVSETAVLGIDCDAAGRVTGVSYLPNVADAHEVRRVRAERVVVSCGAIESARLLLSSTSAREPQGLGNNHDQVGRHLQGHIYSAATGLMADVVEDGQGPGPSVATTRFMHDNEGIIGGGLLADDFVLLPIIAWRDHLPPGAPRWGEAGASFMRDNYRRLLKVCGPIQEIPNPESRVTLDANVRDNHGRRVARLSGTVHPESVRAAEFLRLRAVDWLRASGAQDVWSNPFTSANFLSAGQHQAGTCRMGEDAKTSVVDRDGRVHGHDNLYVIDASVHVTNGGVNPVLTIMALALRNAEAIARVG
jgi:choline dehydrogenase-like flavoprotein